MTVAFSPTSPSNSFYSEQWEPVSLTFGMPLALQQMFDKLAALASLPENWDGYGSLPLQPLAKKTASNLLRMIFLHGLPIPHFVPVSGGGIQMEWQKNKREMELEVLPNGEILFLVVDQTGRMQEGSLPHSLSPTMQALAAWLNQ